MKFITTNASYRESVTVYRGPQRQPVKLMDLEESRSSIPPVKGELKNHYYEDQWTNAQENAPCDAPAILKHSSPLWNILWRVTVSTP
jgi:hypothetical protein